MKKLRSLFAVLLALTMLLAGCGGETDEAVQEEEPAAKDLSLGMIADGVYTNDYLDVRFAPEGWTMQGAEELQNVMDGAASALDGTELEEQIAGLEQVMDLQAVAPNGMTNVNIIYTKMSGTERLANLAVDEDTAMDAILDQIETLKESYSAAGINVSSMEKVNVVYRGEDRVGIRTLGNVQGMDLCIIQVYERTLGSYSAVITATAATEEETLNVLGMFDKLNP